MVPASQFPERETRLPHPADRTPLLSNAPGTLCPLGPLADVQAINAVGDLTLRGDVALRDALRRLPDREHSGWRQCTMLTPDSGPMSWSRRSPRSPRLGNFSMFEHLEHPPVTVPRTSASCAGRSVVLALHAYEPSRFESFGLR